MRKCLCQQPNVSGAHIPVYTMIIVGDISATTVIIIAAIVLMVVSVHACMAVSHLVVLLAVSIPPAAGWFPFTQRKQ